MTNISILGSGRVASALAAQLVRAGYVPIIGIEDPEAPSKNWAGPETGFHSTSDAIAASDIVFNATPGETSVAFLAPHGRALAGKVLIDASNALQRNEKGMPIGLKYPGSSIAEKLQETLPECWVVKTLNTMIFAVIAKPAILESMPVAFLSGDDAIAKAKVRTLLLDFGWGDDFIEDLGGIKTARGPEAFMHFVPHIIANHGFKPFALTIAR